jgi:hypothetical protein
VFNALCVLKSMFVGTFENNIIQNNC